MTGPGFLVEFETALDAPLTEPRDFADGNTFGDDVWPENGKVHAIENVQPVSPEKTKSL